MAFKELLERLFDVFDIVIGHGLVGTDHERVSHDPFGSSVLVDREAGVDSLEAGVFQQVPGPECSRLDLVLLEVTDDCLPVERCFISYRQRVRQPARFDVRMLLGQHEPVLIRSEELIELFEHLRSFLGERFEFVELFETESRACFGRQEIVPEFVEDELRIVLDIAENVVEAFVDVVRLVGRR